MQLNVATARELGLNVPTYVDGMCIKSNAATTCYFTNDERFNPEKNIQAGTLYLSKLVGEYRGYTDKEEFVLASYNGGSGLIKEAIARTKLNKKDDDPNWLDVAEKLTPELLGGFYPYSSWNDEERKKKIEQIIYYVFTVRDLMWEYEGDAELPTPSPTPSSTPESNNDLPTPVSGGGNSKLTGEKIITFDFLGVNVQIGEKYKSNFQCVVDSLNEDNSCRNSYTLKSDYIVGFEDRVIVGGTTPSSHAYGKAIDINQDDNPYCKIKNGNILSCWGEVGCCAQDVATKTNTPGAKANSDCSADWEIRCQTTPIKNSKNLPIVTDIPSCWVQSFKKCGFKWGGDSWNTITDPQHFEVI